MIPISIGYTMEVTFGGKNITLVHFKLLSNLCAGALSSSKTHCCLCLLATFLSNHFKYWLNNSPVIQALPFQDQLTYLSTLKSLKLLGFLFFPITHSFALSLPVRLLQTAIVILYFYFLIPLTSPSSAKIRDLSGSI